MPKEDLFEIRAQKLEAFEDSGGVAFPRGFDVAASLGSVAARFANHDTYFANKFPVGWPNPDEKGTRKNVFF